MNIVLLHPEDLTSPHHARIEGRRLRHIQEIHRAKVGDDLKVGLLGGQMGVGHILSLSEDALEMECEFTQAPPPKKPWTLVVALPRPKVLNRLIASATSLGFKEIILLNAWKVEKSYWKSPRMTPENLQAQCILGLEQARDTVLPTIRIERFFRAFAEKDMKELAQNSNCLLAHPGIETQHPPQHQAQHPAPRSNLQTPSTTLAVGPEGGWIDAELTSFLEAGFQPTQLGERILRTETAVAFWAGRIDRA